MLEAYGASIAFFHRCWEENGEPGWESAGLQQASLPSHRPALPSPPILPTAQSPAQLEGQSPPTAPSPLHSPRLWLASWLACQPSASPPPPSVLTPSLSGWLWAVIGTRQPQPGLAEKRLSESQQSNQSLLRSVLEWAGQSSAEQSSRRVIAASGTMVIGCLRSNVYIN